MDQNHEQLIEEITNRIKAGGDVSNYKKDRKIAGFVTLLSKLNSFPKAVVPPADFMRVKNQILDRIAVPETEKEPSWFVASLPNFFQMGAVIMGSLLIVISLTLGTAVAALQSVPGQAIYPLKKVVENIQLKLTPDDQKPSLQMLFANNRIDELTEVLQQQQDGQISAQAAQRIVADTVKDLQKTTNAAAKSTAQQPKAAIATKLADLSNKLRIASIRTEGEVKIELEKALQTTQDSQQEAIKNIEQAGIKVEGQIQDDNSVQASGKLTAATDTYVSIGSAKFLLTKDTKYVNITAADLAVNQVVDIQGQIKDNKTYAQTITLIADKKTSSDDTKTDKQASAPTEDSQ